ncbi:MAG: hypothetical protein AB8H47_10935 [Bacteroidia bacterium]
MKTSRTLFLIVSSMFVCIGLLHLWVHFAELITVEYESALSPIDHLVLNGQSAHIWLLWQGFSFMMGIGLIFIGLLNFGYLLGKNAMQSPPLMVFGIMIAFLGFVIFSGFRYFEMVQVYGGILGIILLSIAAYKKKFA